MQHQQITGGQICGEGSWFHHPTLGLREDVPGFTQWTSYHRGRLSCVARVRLPSQFADSADVMVGTVEGRTHQIRKSGIAQNKSVAASGFHALHSRYENATVRYLIDTNEKRLKQTDKKRKVAYQVAAWFHLERNGMTTDLFDSEIHSENKIETQCYKHCKNQRKIANGRSTVSERHPISCNRQPCPSAFPPGGKEWEGRLQRSQPKIAAQIRQGLQKTEQQQQQRPKDKHNTSNTTTSHTNHGVQQRSREYKQNTARTIKEGNPLNQTYF